MENEIIIFEIALIVIIVVLIISGLIHAKKNKWVSAEVFQKAKAKIRPHCSEDEFGEFMQFLKSYKGGYVRRRSGKIVFQDYLGKEKGDLKGIFFNVIIPNPNLSSSEKEEFRRFLVSIGVNGVDQRPAYETRDSKLKNRKTDEEEFKRKEVGNRGEQLVRNVLAGLDTADYAVINGPVLKCGDVIKEYDHIVIGKSGVFSIETKAFGMSEGKPSKASLFIDDGDKWIIRKNKNNRELLSPTQQVIEEKEQLEKIIVSCPVIVHPILVLSNTELFIKNNIKLPYDIVKVDELEEFIFHYNDRLPDNDKMFILQDIDKSRIN